MLKRTLKAWISGQTPLDLIVVGAMAIHAVATYVSVFCVIGLPLLRLNRLHPLAEQVYSTGITLVAIACSIPLGWPAALAVVGGGSWIAVVASFPFVALNSILCGRLFGGWLQQVLEQRKGRKKTARVTQEWNRKHS